MNDTGISIVVSSRCKDNINHNLLKLLNELEANTKYKEKLEVLVKFDDDDQIDYLDKLNDYSFKVKYIFSPKGRGYIDLHVFYSLLFLEANPEYNIIVAMADDFGIAVKDWDEIVYKTARNDELFILHNWMPNLNLPVDRICSEAHHVDEAPMWSRKLIELFGGFGQISFTDGWTIGVEWMLNKHFDMSITKYLGECLVTRDLCINDGPSSPRWGTDRVSNMNLFLNENFTRLLYAAALNIANYENKSAITK